MAGSRDVLIVAPSATPASTQLGQVRPQADTDAGERRRAERRGLLNGRDFDGHAQKVRLENNLRYLIGEELINYLGSDYTNE